MHTYCKYLYNYTVHDFTCTPVYFDGFEIYIINTMSIEHEDVPSMLLKFIKFCDMCTLYFHGHSQAYLFVNAMKWNFMYECLQFHFHLIFQNVYMYYQIMTW